MQTKPSVDVTFYKMATKTINDVINSKYTLCSVTNYSPVFNTNIMHS